MSKIKEYQDTYLQATQRAMQQMANNNFAEHGLNQNGDPMRHYSNERNEAVRVVEEVDHPSATSPKIGAGHLAAMGRMGLDELGHALARPFHDADTVPIVSEPGAFGEPTPQEVYAGKQDKSPLEALQKDLYTPQLEQQKEMER